MSYTQPEETTKSDNYTRDNVDEGKRRAKKMISSQIKTQKGKTVDITPVER